jgi:hypothetical protein
MTEQASNEMVWNDVFPDRPPKESWLTEPDKVVWVDEATDLDCMIVRGPVGSWCGYVAVPFGHPHYGRDYDEVDADVHGGLTYANECGGHVCHIPREGHTDDVWWLGFDCAHGGDLCPSFESLSSLRRGTYKDMGYVKREVEMLAHQLAEVTA